MLDHPISTYQVIKFGRHEEESLGIGNQKFQLLK
jgi:hypothetical protein